MTQHWNMDAKTLSDMLARFEFTPCGASEEQSYGWTYPRPDGDFVYSSNGQWLLNFRTEKKLLPASVVNEVAKQRAAAIAEEQGFAPGRKAMKDIKERTRDELLPRAFTTITDVKVWIDPINGWLVVDTASPTKADEIMKVMLKAIDRLPISGFSVKTAPSSAMTSWLTENEAPAGFTIDQEAELSSVTEDKATVRYVRHTLDEAEVARHIGAGKQCKKLALTWNDRISFVLDATLSIRKVKALDIIEEQKDKGANEGDRFDADFALMTGELNQMLEAVTFALGGENNQQTDLVQETEAVRNSANDDELLAQATQIVISNDRASISLVQRHLRIGYNRAAHLMEKMEMQGIISPMAANGSRTVLAGAAA
ncbi:recombination-associated protein RdgC [Undibacterium sp. WLHG33]|uniref:recombination-associated protein RdgC n=1 Tax=Undibacterium sp. WLHG33 TaxID=3412482 RepID=UPI003C2B7F8F